MRRVATHRVYDLMTSQWMSFPVIELGEDGRVCRVYPLTGEISHTEWLPGVILLSPCPVSRRADEAFSVFIERITGVASRYTDIPKRAYWISSFNLSAFDFTGSSRVVAL